MSSRMSCCLAVMSCAPLFLVVASSDLPFQASQGGARCARLARAVLAETSTSSAPLITRLRVVRWVQTFAMGDQQEMLITVRQPEGQDSKIVQVRGAHGAMHACSTRCHGSCDDWAPA